MEDDGATASQLADATATDERYAREWLEQQAVASILDVDDAVAQPEQRRYRLPKGHDEVLLERDSLDYAAPLAQQMVSLTRPLAAVLEASRRAEGCPIPTMGRTCARASQTPTGRCSSTSWAPSGCPPSPRVTKVRADPPARVADIGCGAGWSSISIARAYPKVLVDGFDLDEGCRRQPGPTPRRRALPTG